MTGEKFTLMQYSISAILELIEAEDFVIPEIQRPFVWKRSQVRDLIDSLYNGYPTGYIITWKNPDVQTKDGAKEMLERLKSHGVKMCLATATDRGAVERILSRLGIDSCFSRIFTSKEVGAGKRFPLIYEKALETLSLPSSEVCVVEDSFVAIESAKLTGAKTIGVFDKHAFNQERLKASSDYYMPEGENLSSLIKVITVKND